MNIPRSISQPRKTSQDIQEQVKLCYKQASNVDNFLCVFSTMKGQ